MDEIKEVVTLTLEKQGVLANLRAQLRAFVFAAIDERETTIAGHGLAQRTKNHKRDQLLSTPEGALLAALTKELLTWCNLDYTAKVFEPEMNMGDTYFSREHLRMQLGITEDEDQPLLATVLGAFLADDKRSVRRPSSAPSSKSLPISMLSKQQMQGPATDATASAEPQSDTIAAVWRPSPDEQAGAEALLAVHSLVSTSEIDTDIEVEEQNHSYGGHTSQRAALFSQHATASAAAADQVPLGTSATANSRLNPPATNALSADAANNDSTPVRTAKEASPASQDFSPDSGGAAMRAQLSDNSSTNYEPDSLSPSREEEPSPNSQEASSRTPAILTVGMESPARLPGKLSPLGPLASLRPVLGPTPLPPLRGTAQGSQQDQPPARRTAEELKLELQQQGLLQPASPQSDTSDDSIGREAMHEIPVDLAKQRDANPDLDQAQAGVDASRHRIRANLYQDDRVGSLSESDLSFDDVKHQYGGGHLSPSDHSSDMGDVEIAALPEASQEEWP
ncbi:hypothetical protein WJX72_008156 [[Myrmecia] bisecta]|uniref:FGFR1 oncogene partner (FOP) N-terminal dimerisation domain-containing protein n=1 Tax=[Myrmecia] bisecta TaxID=41462 RepID=A0AAW1Q443_9CHLO